MFYFKYLVTTLILVNSVLSQVNETDTSMVFTHDKSDILSRKKRFLIFPEGSSFQLGKN